MRSSLRTVEFTSADADLTDACHIDHARSHVRTVQ